MLKNNRQTPVKLLLAGILAAPAAVALAGGTIEVGDNKSISIGAGIRTAFTAVEDAAPSGDVYSKDFAIQNIEGEPKAFDTDLSAAALADTSSFNLFDGTSYFATAAYLVGSPMGKGKIQPYVMSPAATQI